MRRVGLLLVVTVVPALCDCALGDFCVQGASGCVDRGCHDGVKGGDETDVDCGGPCAPCEDGRACAAPEDCASARCVAALCCEAPCGVWATSFGALGDDLVTSVAAAPDGTLYVVGLFHGIVDFGDGPLSAAGGADAFALAIDPGGATRWSLALGGVADELTARVAVTAAGQPVIALGTASTGVDLGGGPLASSGDRNLFLVGLDAAGQHLWSRAYPTTSRAWPTGLAVAPGGDLVLVGTFSQVDLGAAGELTAAGGQSYDALVARLDPTGAPRWARRFGSIWNDYATAVAVDVEGGLYVTVAYSRSWTFGGAVLPPTGGAYGTAVVKLDGTGHHVWSHGYPTPAGAFQRPNAVAVDDQGHVLVGGVYTAPVDFGTGPLPAGIFASGYVASFDAASGALAWARGFGEHTADVQAIAPAGDGGALVAGLWKGNLDLGAGVALENGLSQLFVARFDASGAARWARDEQAVLAREDFETGAAGASLAAGPGALRVTVAGGFVGTLDVGTTPRVSVGTTATADAFVAVLAP